MDACLSDTERKFDDMVNWVFLWMINCDLSAEVLRKCEPFRSHLPGRKKEVNRQVGAFLKTEDSQQGVYDTIKDSQHIGIRAVC